jgi:hypothetical protein
VPIDLLIIQETDTDKDAVTDSFGLSMTREMDCREWWCVSGLGMQVMVIMSSASWREVHEDLIEQEFTKALK